MRTILLLSMALSLTTAHAALDERQVDRHDVVAVDRDVGLEATTTIVNYQCNTVDLLVLDVERMPVYGDGRQQDRWPTITIKPRSSDFRPTLCGAGTGGPSAL